MLTYLRLLQIIKLLDFLDPVEINLRYTLNWSLCFNSFNFPEPKWLQLRSPSEASWCTASWPAAWTGAWGRRWGRPRGTTASPPQRTGTPPSWANPEHSAHTGRWRAGRAGKPQTLQITLDLQLISYQWNTGLTPGNHWIISSETPG